MFDQFCQRLELALEVNCLILDPLHLSIALPAHKEVNAIGITIALACLARKVLAENLIFSLKPIFCSDLALRN